MDQAVAEQRANFTRHKKRPLLPQGVSQQAYQRTLLAKEHLQNKHRPLSFLNSRQEINLSFQNSRADSPPPEPLPFQPVLAKQRRLCFQNTRATVLSFL